MKHTIFVPIFLVLCSVVFGAEIPFAVYDPDGNPQYGQLQALTSDKIVLLTDEGEKEFLIKHVSLLDNLSRNPFVSGESTPEKDQKIEQAQVDQWGNRLNIRFGGRIVLRGGNAVPAPQNNNRGRREVDRQVASWIEKKGNEPVGAKAEESLPNSLAVLTLTDGSRLLATELTAKGKTATIKLFPNGELTLPLSSLTAALLKVDDPARIGNPPPDWMKYLVQQATKGDRLVVGQPGSLDAHDGIVNELGAETVRFTVDGDVLPVPRRKVFGLLFHQPEPPKPVKPFCRLHFWSGAVGVLKTLELRSDGLLAWTTLNGTQGTSRLDEIDEIVFETINSLSLTDLQPSGLKQQLSFAWEKAENTDASPLSLFQEFQAKRILQGQPTPPNAEPALAQVMQRRIAGDSRQSNIPELPIPGLKGVQLDGAVYAQGLVIQAKTTISFTLKEPFKTLRARIGVDDRIRPDGQARLTILGDERLLYDGTVLGTEPSKSLQLNVDGVKTLTLTVDYLSGVSEASTVSIADLKLLKD